MQVEFCTHRHTNTPVPMNLNTEAPNKLILENYPNLSSEIKCTLLEF